MAVIRPQKTWRMSYWGTPAVGSGAEPMLSLLGDPGEARMSAGNKSFISVKEDSVTISGGFPSKFNIQGMSSSFKYGGMVQDLPWPLSMIPSTLVTPFPKQIMAPPLVEILPTIQQIAMIATSLAGF